MNTRQQRSVAVEEYRLLQQPHRAELTGLAELAARVCDVPMAAIMVLGDAGPYSVGSFGFDADQEAAASALCTSSLLDSGPFVIPDAAADERYVASVFVNGERSAIRFSAAHPLTTPEGVRFGVVCVFDEEPRAAVRQADDLALIAERVVGVFELELASRRLFEASEALAVAQDGLAAFAGTVSHDLKNPLAAVAMSLEIAQDNIDPADTLVASMVARAERGAQRMKDMIDDLHSYARQGTPPEKRDVKVGDLVAVALGGLPDSVERSVVEVGPMPTVVADPGQLQVVLSNLLDNAVKFADPTRSLRVVVSATQGDDEWVLSVADSGVGVPAGERVRVFEPLARLDKSVPGTGLGLTTARRIVKAHQGRIWLDETLGGGTTVQFTLPHA
ncbi:sensor histidine kinase [Nocardioides sp. LHG3406-4]|uniref:sensor histidine kinase n=1 Tax=Nocardioides sp. LHG3406-4 TaxID=2804575 RepID=UPI003CEFC451